MSKQGNSTSLSPQSSSGNSSPPSKDSKPPPPSPPTTVSRAQESPTPPSNLNKNDNNPPPDNKNDKNPPPDNKNDKNPPPDNKNDNHKQPPAPKTNSNNEKSNSSPKPPPSPHAPPTSQSKEKSLFSHLPVSKEKAIIAGASAGGGLLLLLFIICCVCCCRRRKRKQRRRKMQYMENFHGPPRNNSNYFNSTGNWPNSAQQNSHEVRMPPGGPVSAEYGWSSQPPPPPPHMMHSSEMNSANYSGGPAQPPPYPAMHLGLNQSSFTYEDLASATGDFAKTNLLGQGGFGYVHKGVLPNGTIVAVKSLKANSGQGEREFQAEVDIISRVHHRHLVSLVGYCIAGDQRMLVYEFVENDTLESHIHGKSHPIMDWPSRLRIALGSAKGFAYLHEDCHPRIIHRDIKAANILLDDMFEAKVADFGLAKLSADTNTHVSTRIMGTFGYLAPEYAASGKLTDKSDVYSYGVVLLELITGKKPVDIHSEDDSLVDWARPILTRAIAGESSYDELADPRLEGNYDPQEMLHMIASASACIRHSARKRPKMSKIVRALEGDASLDDLDELVISSQTSTCGSRSSNVSTHEFNKGIKRNGLSSQELSSSEYGMSTSDFETSSNSRGKAQR